MKLRNPQLFLITLLSVLSFITKGIDNIGNWRFYAALIGMIGFISLCLFSITYGIRQSNK